MKEKFRLLIVLNILVIVLYGCGRSEEPKKEESKEEHSQIVNLSKESIAQINLQLQTIQMEPFTGYLTIPAKVITNQDKEAQIGSLVQGRVHQVFVQVGAYVKTGQVMMTVEGLDIGEIKAAYLKAKANLDFVKADYERHKTLFEQNIGSKQSYLEVKSEFEKATAEFNAEDRKIHSIGFKDEDILDENKDDHTSGTLPIKSSINGIVVERNVVIGQLVDATTNAFKVINTNDVWVDGQIYEKDIPKVNQKTDAIFSSSTYKNEQFKGRVIYIGQTIDEHSHTLTIRAEFANPSNKLKPQMFGDLKIPLNANAKIILVDEEAIIREANAAYVFVQTSETQFEKRNVILGTAFDNKIEIKDGLKEGDKVVAKGSFYLKSEMKKEELGGE